MVPRPFTITRHRYKSRCVPFAKKFAVKLAKSLDADIFSRFAAYVRASIAKEHVLSDAGAGKKKDWPRRRELGFLGAWVATSIGVQVPAPSVVPDRPLRTAYVPRSLRSRLCRRVAAPMLYMAEEAVFV